MEPHAKVEVSISLIFTNDHAHNMHGVYFQCPLLALQRGTKKATDRVLRVLISCQSLDQFQAPLQMINTDDDNMIISYDHIMMILFCHQMAADGKTSLLCPGDGVIQMEAVWWVLTNRQSSLIEML